MIIETWAAKNLCQWEAPIIMTGKGVRVLSGHSYTFMDCDRWKNWGISLISLCLDIPNIEGDACTRGLPRVTEITATGLILIQFGGNLVESRGRSENVPLNLVPSGRNWQ